MIILNGQEAPSVSIGCKKGCVYSEMQRLIGNPINIKTHDDVLLNDFLFTGDDEIEIHLETEEGSSIGILKAYCLQDNYVQDTSDIIGNTNELVIKFNEMNDSINSIVIWVHHTEIQEHTGVLRTILKNKGIHFREIPYEGCAMSYKVLYFIRCQNGWIVEESNDLLHINQIGVSKVYGLL